MEKCHSHRASSSFSGFLIAFFLLLTLALASVSANSKEKWEKDLLELKVSLATLESKISNLPVLDYAFKVNHLDERLGRLDDKVGRLLELVNNALNHDSTTEDRARAGRVESGLNKVAYHLQGILSRQEQYEKHLANVTVLLKSGVDKLLQKVDSVLSIGTLFQGMSTNLRDLLITLGEQETQLEILHDTLHESNAKRTSSDHLVRTLIRSGVENITEITRQVSKVMLGEDEFEDTNGTLHQGLCGRQFQHFLETILGRFSEFLAVAEQMKEEVVSIKHANNHTMNLMFDLYAIMSTCHPPKPPSKRRRFFG